MCIGYFKGWVLISLCCVGLSVAVAGMWIVEPTLFLCAFLIASALHFAGDPAAGVTKTSRGLYGGAMIVLPAGWHGEEMQRLLGWVAGPDSAAAVAPVLGKLAVPWLVATMLACAFQFRRSLLAACESAGLAALLVAAPPLVAFCAYFSPGTSRDVSFARWRAIQPGMRKHERKTRPCTP